jgi:hypothetical protein
MDSNRKPLCQLNQEALIGPLITATMKHGYNELFFFWDKYRSYPSTYTVYFNEESYIQYDSLLSTLKDRYNHNTGDDIFEYSYRPNTKKPYVSQQLCDMQNGVMINVGCQCLSDEQMKTQSSDDTLDLAKADRVFVTSKL